MYHIGEYNVAILGDSNLAGIKYTYSVYMGRNQVVHVRSDFNRLIIPLEPKHFLIDH